MLQPHAGALGQLLAAAIAAPPRLALRVGGRGGDAKGGQLVAHGVPHRVPEGQVGVERDVEPGGSSSDEAGAAGG
jgi:hypothetical protein